MNYHRNKIENYLISWLPSSESSSDLFPMGRPKLVDLFPTGWPKRANLLTPGRPKLIDPRSSMLSETETGYLECKGIVHFGMLSWRLYS